MPSLTAFLPKAKSPRTEGIAPAELPGKRLPSISKYHTLPHVNRFPLKNRDSTPATKKKPEFIKLFFSFV